MPDDDLELYKSLCEEGRETVDHQITALNDIDSKSNRILRLNFLIIGAALTVLSISVRTEQFGVQAFINPYSRTGIVLLLLSTALAGLTYTASDVEPGIRDSEIRNVVSSKTTTKEHFIQLAYGYANWIEFNDETNIRNSFLITATILFAVFGISALSLGVADGITGGSLPDWIDPALAVLLLFITYLSGIVGQARDVIDLTQSVNTLQLAFAANLIAVTELLYQMFQVLLRWLTTAVSILQLQSLWTMLCEQASSLASTFKLTAGTVWNRGVEVCVKLRDRLKRK